MDIKLRKLLRTSALIICVCLLLASVCCLAVADANEGTLISSGIMQDGVFVANNSSYYIGRDSEAIQLYTQRSYVCIFFAVVAGAVALFMPKPKELI